MKVKILFWCCTQVVVQKWLPLDLSNLISLSGFIFQWNLCSMRVVYSMYMFVHTFLYDTSLARSCHSGSLNKYMSHHGGTFIDRLGYILFISLSRACSSTRRTTFIFCIMQYFFIPTFTQVPGGVPYIFNKLCYPLFSRTLGQKYFGGLILIFC